MISITELAQGLLKQQFLGISGLRSPLLQKKIRKHPKAKDRKRQIPIIHSCGNHRIVAATDLGGHQGGAVNVYDSIFPTLDQETHNISLSIFPMTTSQELVTIHR